MSYSRDPRRLRAGVRGDAGFTLLEVIVALGVMTAVMVALLPQLVVGIKSTGTARLVTQAKGMAQGELERMRNLPYHIAPAAGDFVDVLDYFYPTLSAPAATPICTASGSYAPPTTGWAGYVAPASTARCAYEPSAGAFYRSVRIGASSAGMGSFTVVTDTQFLSGATPPTAVTPLNGYDSRAAGKDNPPSAQIGVTVTLLYSDRDTLRPVSTYTQIAQRLPTTTRVQAAANVTAVEVGSVTSDKVPLSLSAGLVNLTSSLSYASTVTANLAATSAGLATGEQGAGASTTAAAPPAVNAPPTNAAAGALSVGGCSYACWGSTQLGPVSVSAEDGLPTAGSPLAPLQALVTDPGNNGFSFGNSPATGYRPGLQLTPPLVRLDTNDLPVPSGLSGCAPGTGGTSSYVTASGYLRTTAPDDPSAPSTVESCAVARTTAISIFPTEFAPRGVVRIQLNRASVRCTVQGSAHSADAVPDYEATVQYWDGSGYVTAATILPSLATDPLESLPMSTPVGGGKTLGSYIASWSSLTGDKVTKVQAGGLAEVALPGVVTVATQPVRPDATAPDGLDPTSVVSVAVGALNCSAEDSR